MKQSKITIVQWRYKRSLVWLCSLSGFSYSAANLILGTTFSFVMLFYLLNQKKCSFNYVLIYLFACFLSSVFTYLLTINSIHKEILLTFDWKFILNNTYQKIVHILSGDIPNYDLRKRTVGLKIEPHFLVIAMKL